MEITSRSTKRSTTRVINIRCCNDPLEPKISAKARSSRRYLMTQQGKVARDKSISISFSHYLIRPVTQPDNTHIQLLLLDNDVERLRLPVTVARVLEQGRPCIHECRRAFELQLELRCRAYASSRANLIVPRIAKIKGIVTREKFYVIAFESCVTVKSPYARIDGNRRYFVVPSVTDVRRVFF